MTNAEKYEGCNHAVAKWVQESAMYGVECFV